MEIDQDLSNTENVQCSPYKVPSVPGTPLQQISPERLNQQRIPHSPSLPLDLNQSPRRHLHRVSDAADVKARVAMLNSLSGSPTRSTSPTKPYNASSHAAIQRAVLGREEAEAALNSMTSALESAKARERLVAERVESLMEQLSDARSRQRHERQIYEKEVKTSRKNEYKAELAVIKLQEEIRELKGELEGTKAKNDHDKAEKEKARQEAFERAYAIAGMTEEMQTLQERLKVAEQERDSAVAMAASKMPVAEAAAQLNPQDRPEAKDAPPIFASATAYLSQVSHVEVADLDAENCSIETKYAALQQELASCKRQRQEDQEAIHFMNMQCQFMACPCRVAERNGVRFVHDYDYDQKVRARNSKKRKIGDEKPLPIFISWKQKMEMKKGKETETHRPAFVRAHTNADSEAMDLDTVQAGPAAHSVIVEACKDEPEVPLPPGVFKTEGQDVGHAEEIKIAAQIPLPPPSGDSPDHTADLEDMTQVIVQPSTSNNLFSFSASTSNTKPGATVIPAPHQAQSDLQFGEDLFDLSPPKQARPRPSTAMGILTVESPIRLVPDSPHANQVLSLTESRTTRVFLNDASPVRQNYAEQQSRSRSHMRSRSRGRSPGLTLATSISATSRPASAFEYDAPSPASSTIFPITPAAKHSRKETQIQSRAETRAHDFYDMQQPDHMVTEKTTTTTIPLRAEDEESVSHPGTAFGSIDTDTPISAVPSSMSATLPGTPITREAALAQIRARRDRARSVNMRKSGNESEQNDGANRAGMKTPGSVARRGVKIDLNNRLGLGERDRDVSHASAPGRF